MNKLNKNENDHEDVNVKEPFFTKLFHIFNDKDSPYQYASPTALYRYIQREEPKEIKKQWPLARVRDFVLFHSRARQIVGSRPSAQFDRSPTLVDGLDTQWQADLVEERKLKWGLGRRKFLLTVIDVFSRQAMVGVASNKSALAVLRAFKKLVDEQRHGRTPRYLQTDQGKEFFNKEFTKYCQEHDIIHFHTYSPMKASIVERFNRTLQEGLAILKRHEPDLSVQQAIQRFTKAYNSRPHRGLGGKMKPSDITYGNQNDLMRLVDNFRRKWSEKTWLKRTPFKFHVGDYVRTSRQKKNKTNAFRKSYRGTWSEQVYRIRQRRREFPRWDLNLYWLETLKQEDIKGRYYEPELLLVSEKYMQEKRPFEVKNRKTGEVR
ncbi:uncharacterized protein [Montipora foliosa]|uniref:uncharacterized protein n=1 Tax=Montipora foliosa TaxID=591990 RepID=UPI0035F19E06